MEFVVLYVLPVASMYTGRIYILVTDLYFACQNFDRTRGGLGRSIWQHLSLTNISHCSADCGQKEATSCVGHQVRRLFPGSLCQVSLVLWKLAIRPAFLYLVPKCVVIPVILVLGCCYTQAKACGVCMISMYICTMVYLMDTESRKGRHTRFVYTFVSVGRHIHDVENLLVVEIFGGALQSDGCW